MRKLLAGLALLATTAVVGVTASVALAVGVSNPQKECSTAEGTWHFVHNKTNATSGTLTAVIGGVTHIVGDNGPASSNNLHYFFTASGALTSASDNVTDGKLVISDCPQGETPPPPPDDTPPPPDDPPPDDTPPPSE